MLQQKLWKQCLFSHLVFIAFIFGFNMLFQANPAFHGLVGTGVKIFVMMQGEFDFDDNLGYKSVHEHGGRNWSIQVTHFPWSKIYIQHALQKHRSISISISDFILSLLDMDGTHFHESFGWFDGQWYWWIEKDGHNNASQKKSRWHLVVIKTPTKIYLAWKPNVKQVERLIEKGKI